MFRRNKSCVLRRCCHGGGGCSIPPGCLAAQAQTSASPDGASCRAWEKDAWDEMRNKIKLFHLFRYSLSTWEGFRGGGKHKAHSPTKSHFIQGAEKTWLEWNTTTKLLNIWKQLKNQITGKTKPFFLESQAMIFKTQLFRRTLGSHFPRTTQNTLFSSCLLWNSFCTCYLLAVFHSAATLQVHSPPTIFIVENRDHSILLPHSVTEELSLWTLIGQT